MTFNRKAAALLAALTLSGTTALVAPSIVSAQTDEAPTEAPAEVQEAPSADSIPADDVSVDDVVNVNAVDLEDLDPEDLEDSDDWEPTPEELAEINAETEELIEALRAADLPVERVEEDGFVYPEFPEDLTEEQWESVDEVATNFYAERGIDFDEEFDDIELNDFEDFTDEGIAELNAETAAFAEALRAAGFEVEVHAEENGLDCLEINGEEDLTDAQYDEISAIAEAFFGPLEDVDVDDLDEYLDDDDDDDDDDEYGEVDDEEEEEDTEAS